VPRIHGLHHRSNNIAFSFIGNSTSPAVGTAFAYLPSKLRERQFLTRTAYKIADGVAFFCPSRAKIDSNYPWSIIFETIFDKANAFGNSITHEQDLCCVFLLIKNAYCQSPFTINLLTDGFYFLPTSGVITIDEI
jgi:hypothetical protein